MATFSLNAATEPTYIDILDIAAGYGIFSTPVDGLLQGDTIQTVTFVVTNSAGAAVISKAVDMVLRADGYFEFVTQYEISAHFTLTAADIAQIAGSSDDFTYSCSIMVVRSGVTITREYQGGAMAARPTVPQPPMVVNSITVSGGPFSGSVGATHQLTATTYDYLGNVITGQVVTWSSNGPAIASVDASGLVTLVTPGIAIIYATCQGLSATATITVSGLPLSPNGGDSLFYNSGLTRWEPAKPTASLISSGSGTALATFGGTLAYHFAHGLVIDAVGLTVTTGSVTAPAMTATTFTGALVGNATTATSATSATSATTATLAATATALATPRAINGVNFDGTAPITVTAAAGTLTGATLAANVLASSLTSVGVLAAPHMTAPVVNSGGMSITGDLTLTGNANIIGQINLTRDGPLDILTSATPTAAAYMAVLNGSGGTAIGVESSTGGSIIPGTAAYASVIGTGSPRSMHLATNNAVAITIDSAQGVAFAARVGFNGVGALAKPTITGSRGGNAAVASLLAALVSYGLIVDSTTA